MERVKGPSVWRAATLQGSVMADLLFLGLMIGFFALAVGLVHVCDRIIGADDDVIVGAIEPIEPTDEVEAAA
jgi:hypothetical protein